MSLVWSHCLWGCMCVSNSFWICWPISTKFSKRVKTSKRDMFLQVWGKQVAGEWMGEPLLAPYWGMRPSSSPFIKHQRFTWGKGGGERLGIRQMENEPLLVLLIMDVLAEIPELMVTCICCTVRFPDNRSSVELGHRTSLLVNTPAERGWLLWGGCTPCGETTNTHTPAPGPPRLIVQDDAHA